MSLTPCLSHMINSGVKLLGNLFPSLWQKQSKKELLIPSQGFPGVQVQSCSTPILSRSMAIWVPSIITKQQNNSSWKGVQEISSPNACSQQLWGQSGCPGLCAAVSGKSLRIEHTTSLGNLWYCLNVFTGRKVFLTSSQSLYCSYLCPLHLIFLPCTAVKIPAPSSQLSLCQCWFFSIPQTCSWCWVSPISLASSYTAPAPSTNHLGGYPLDSIHLTFSCIWAPRTGCSTHWSQECCGKGDNPSLCDLGNTAQGNSDLYWHMMFFLLRFRTLSWMCEYHEVRLGRFLQPV